MIFRPIKDYLKLLVLGCY